ncbi:MAG: hypothetical protein H6Q73_4025 [Firmicutes bacterium]|nr:hypothetical protein [Bacillota bacterium]
MQDRKRFWLMLLLMLVNDFISPRIYGDFWYDKPPMYYWLVAGSFKAFGVSEFAARFPSALSAVLCVVLVYWAMGGGDR